MIDLATLLNFVPLTPQAIFVLLVDSLLAAIAIIAVNKLLAHEFEIKHALILSIVALFFTPVISALVLSFIAPPMWITLYVLPLFVWIVLGEALLSSDMMT
ncbi:MAG: hypothetical protein HY832_02760 [Candidatus Aenigmarchaeota archaeon]|nr:hypothetical protein [Candidatus Aenigmarchaeota archaeon]